MNYFWRQNTILWAILLLSPLSLNAQFEPNQNVSVMVRLAKLRLIASNWSVVVEDLPYGAQVRFVGQQGAWVEVEAPSGKRGFIQESAISVRRVILAAGAASGQAGFEATDVVLAGKGFNADVEDLYQDQVEGLDMALVDRWEQEVITDAELETFLQAGELVR